MFGLPWYVNLIIFVVIIIILIGLLALWYKYCYCYHDFTGIANESKFVRYPKNKNECLEELRQKKGKYDKKIAIVSLSVGEREFSKTTKKVLQEYCNRYGYNLCYFDKILDPNYYIVWQKILAVQKTLKNKKYDYVVWIDDDILITNFKYRIEDFISLTNKDIVMSRDLRGDHGYNQYINSGIFILKNNKTSRNFMKDVIDNYGIYNGRFKNKYEYDQSVINYMFFKKYHPYVDVIPQGVMQTMHTHGWNQGDFAYHMTANKIKVAERNQLCNKVYNLIEK